MNDGADTLALMHEVKRFVDVFERHGVGNKLVDFDVAVHILINHSR